MKRREFIAFLLIYLGTINTAYSLPLSEQQGSFQLKAFACYDNSISIVSSISYGEARSVLVKGSYAYVGTSVALLIIDIKNPTKPQLVGHVHILSGGIGNLALQDSLLYGVGPGGLYVIDVSNPKSPVEIGSWAKGTWLLDISLSGHYAYIAAGSEGLQVMDISKPHSPTPVGYYTGIEALGVRVSGQYAYIADFLGIFYVFDVSDPTAPKKVGYVTTTGHAVGLSLSGFYAYVSIYEGQYKSRMDIIDIYNLRVVGSYQVSDIPPSIYAFEPLVYLAIPNLGLSILDVSEPTDPKEVGHYDGAGYVALYVASDYAYVAAASKGLGIFNVADPAHPQEVGDYPTALASYQSLQVADDHAYLACADSGFQIMDISDPQAPQMVGLWNGQRPQGGYDTGFILNSLALYEKYAYVTDWRGGVYILDVSDPSNPKKVGYYTLEHGVDNPIIYDNYLYVTAVFKGLYILDISDPTVLQEAGSYDLVATSWRQVRDLTLADGYAYLLAKIDDQERLLILDLSDRSHPRKVGEYGSDGVMRAIEVKGDYAYVLSDPPTPFGQAKLLIIDISQKTTPRLVSEFELQGNRLASAAVRILDHYAFLYVSGHSFSSPAKIIVIDLSVPDQPTQVAEREVSYREGELYSSNFLFVTQDNYIYLALGINGLDILKFTPSTGVEASLTELEHFSLQQNYPNPFNSTTTVNYRLPKAARVTLKIYNLLGQVVRTLVDAYQESGTYAARWDGRDDRGRELPSGVYLYRLQIGTTETKRNSVKIAKMLLMR